MALTNKDTLKGYFKAGAIPTEANFSDLVDSVLSENGNNLLFLDNAKSKIGIGTESPVAKLDVAGKVSLQTAEGRNFFKDSEKNDGAGLRVGAAWGLYGIYAENGACAVAGIEGVSLQNGGVIVKKGGNVGIGTTSPQAPLHIKGNAGNLILEGIDHNYIQFFPKGFAEGRKAWLGFGGAKSEILEITNEFPGNKIKLNHTVSVGSNLMVGNSLMIGGENADYKFYSKSGAAIGLFESTENQAYLRISTNEGIENRVEFCNRGSGRAAIWVPNAGDVLSVLSTGRVGIGTSTPNQKIEIGSNGGLGFSGPNLNSADKKLYSPADGDLEWMTHSNAPAHGFAVSHQGSKAVYLNTDGNSFLNGGNVGIGTTKPLQKLHIAGAAQIDGAIYAGTSDIYFLNTSHQHTGWGNQPNCAAIENSEQYKCLMILGRNMGTKKDLTDLKRVVKVWDELWVADKQVSASDIREKTNIEPLDYGLKTINELRPVSYNWIKNKNGQKNIGLIAQEVMPVVREAVHFNESNPDEPGWGISYQSLIPVLINAIKELDIKIQSIQGQRAEAKIVEFD